MIIVSNYGKLSTKLLSGTLLRFIEEVELLSFFLAQTTVKLRLNPIWTGGGGGGGGGEGEQKSFAKYHKNCLTDLHQTF